MTIVDLSISLENELPSDPASMIPEITYFGHEEGAQDMTTFFANLKKDQLPDSKGWAIERVKLTTHSGTHLDAPYHFHPTTNNGKNKALTIDKIPLEWCYSDGVLLDFSYKNDGEKISVNDVEKELAKIQYKIKPLDIVLIHTGASKYWGTPEYLTRGPGMTRESTLFLLDQGVKITGIDSWSWDRPFSFIQKEFDKTADASIIWEAHFAGIEKEYCHIEKMTNLMKITRPHGFKVCCFPVKIKNASASWVRPVAIY